MTSRRPRIGVIIPALDEESSVGQVIRRTRVVADSTCDWRIVVADNESSDDTTEVARNAGAEVTSASPRGYGAACLAGLAHLGDWPDIVVFLDADGSSRPEEIPDILAPLFTNGATDLVIGVRPPNAPMTLPQKWGSRLAVLLVGWVWGKRYHDMGPMRAIRRHSLNKIGMQDQTWGWTIEMQILALRHGLQIEEVPVSWETRIAGVSKISGTVSGVVRAGARILWTIGKHAALRNSG